MRASGDSQLKSLISDLTHLDLKTGRCCLSSAVDNRRPDAPDNQPWESMALLKWVSTKMCLQRACAVFGYNFSNCLVLRNGTLHPGRELTFSREQLLY